ncbi:MAG: cysteine--tRNA ligase [Oligoflexia bacterium]|nr:cysteine--tRNA ligase [Oligoflexia bacterium]
MSELRLYNTLTRTIETFQPAEPGKVRMYVCGMTVYDYCHIGHARAMITFDVVYRWLRERGLDVSYIRNHTDVDDKIIACAAKLGQDPLAVSARFILALDQDLARLGLAAPTLAPKVSDHIPQIIAMISALIKRGHAYDSAGDVFFSVESFSDYGKLSGKKVSDLRSGERIAVDPRKRHPADFALWKSAKPDEIAWDSPWGRGRPGWHIECSVMATTHLGDRFDIHGGGIDLAFPHHENEIAQAECATGHAPFARYWIHNGMLTLVDETGTPVKMSKSIGNVVLIRDLVDQVPAEAIRIMYLDSHYRSPLPFGPAKMHDALVAAERIYLARQVLEQIVQTETTASAAQTASDLGGDAQDLFDAASSFAERFGQAMDDDFNTARAIAELFDLVRVVNRFGNHKKWWKRSAALAGLALQGFDLTGRVLGLGGRDSSDFFADLTDKLLLRAGQTRADIQAHVAQREAARTARDWALADQLRDTLDQMGVVLMDSPEGTHWRMRVTQVPSA